MRSLALLVLVSLACCGVAPVASPEVASSLPADPPVRKWPASQPDLAGDVDAMVQYGNAMCDCAAQTNVACARNVVADMRLWIEDVHTFDHSGMTPEQTERASVALDRIQECGDEMLGSGSWCAGS
jgi:hypothetical protein